MNHSKYLATAFIFVISILLIALFTYLFDQQNITNKRINNLYESSNEQTKELANLNESIKSHYEKSHEITASIISNEEAVIPVDKTCVLSGGEIVEDGWVGKDTGNNYCNQCRCMDGAMACTKMACINRKSDSISDNVIASDGKENNKSDKYLDKTPDIINVILAKIISDENIDNNNLILDSFEEVTWNSSALGCPVNGVFYAQVMTDGYKLNLLKNNEIEEYHSDLRSNYINCTKIRKSNITTTEVTKNCEQSNNFIDIKANEANNLYPSPKLEVRCEGDLLIIKSNGIPVFEFKTTTPNPLLEQSHNWSIPQNPKLADSITDLPLLGTVAVAIDGLPYYGPNEGPPQGFGDPFLDEILDYCNGHTAPGGDYHYHSVPSCLVKINKSTVIGYALDGFEIVSPNKNIKSSWKKTSNARSAWEANEFVEGSGELDKCNGKIDDDGVYRYHATNSFPYIIGCYKGVIENISNNNTSSINDNPRQRSPRSQNNPPLRQMPKRND